ncbi:MAG: NBR1-Ig-like domain-containing protein [Chloroflexi bacterium]|nr:NBR1-Ig-like domain-containing protein [Chloroflexota bacterium]
MENKARLAMLAVLLLLLILVVTFSIGGANRAAQTPTVSVGNVQTAAIATFGSGLTQTALAIPTNTSTATAQPTSTESISPTPSCYRLRFIQDLTIPDHTAMKPGQSFTKTWLVQNNGTCTWQSGFKFSLVGGVAMGTTSVSLNPTVAPSGRIPLSVSLTVPTGQTGTLIGTWRMSDQDGNFFGDALTVVIDVGGAATATPKTGGVTETATP